MMVYQLPAPSMVTPATVLTPHPLEAARLLELSAADVQANRLGAAVSGLYNTKAARLLRSVIDEVDGEGVVYHLHNWSKILSPSALQALSSVAFDTATISPPQTIWWSCSMGSPAK